MIYARNIFVSEESVPTPFDDPDKAHVFSDSFFYWIPDGDGDLVHNFSANAIKMSIYDAQGSTVQEKLDEYGFVIGYEVTGTLLLTKTVGSIKQINYGDQLVYYIPHSFYAYKEMYPNPDTPELIQHQIFPDRTGEEAWIYDCSTGTDVKIGAGKITDTEEGYTIFTYDADPRPSEYFSWSDDRGNYWLENQKLVSEVLEYYYHPFTEKSDYFSWTIRSTAAIRHGDTITDAGGGDDYVSLPDEANYALSNGIKWDPSVMFHGGDGNDYIWGGDGNDEISGDENDDHLYGGEGNDVLHGGWGSDEMDGGGGDDTIYGIDPTPGGLQFETNTLTAGAGNNTAIWSGEFGQYVKNFDISTDRLVKGQLFKLTVSNRDSKDILQDNFQHLIFHGHEVKLVEIQSYAVVKWVLETLSKLGDEAIKAAKKVGWKPPPELASAMDSVNLIRKLGVYALEAKTAPDTWKQAFIGANLFLIDVVQLGADKEVKGSSLITGKYFDALRDAIRLHGAEVFDDYMKLTLPAAEAMGGSWVGDLYIKAVNSVTNKYSELQNFTTKAAETWMKFQPTIKNMINGTDGNDHIQVPPNEPGTYLPVPGTLGYKTFTDGGKGNDVITGSLQNDLIVAGAGNDVVHSGGGNDGLIAGSGAGNDYYDGGAGVDTLFYTSTTTGITVSLTTHTAVGAEINADQIYNIENVVGGSGADSITGDGNANSLKGAAGNDKLSGAGGDDILFGGAGADRLDGGLGTDTASYESSTTSIVANLATSSANTGEAKGDIYVSIENLVGSAFGDQLGGNASSNQLSGGAGNDRISSGPGNDLIIGGAGADSLYGGTGLDNFVYSAITDTIASAQDTIFDFNHAEGDKISLAAIDAIAGTTANDAFKFIGTAAFTGVKGQLHYTHTTTDTYVSGDVNGDKVADFMIHLVGNKALVAGDFLL